MPQIKSEIADISPLDGRIFVPVSGNRCRIERIGPGGIRLNWMRPTHSQQDYEELLTWAEGLIGPLCPTEHCDLRTERAAFELWTMREGTKKV